MLISHSTSGSSIYSDQYAFRPRKQNVFEPTKIPKDKPNPLYLEDLAPGQEFVSRSTTPLTGDQIKTFAGQYDPQPFHTDEEAAKGSFFKQLVASGLQTTSIATRLIMESVPLADGLVGTNMDLKFLQPVRVGDSLHVKTEVVSRKEAKPGLGRVHLKHQVLNQDDEPVEQIDSQIIASSKKPASS